MNDYRTMTARVTSVSHHYPDDRVAAPAPTPSAEADFGEADFGEYGLKLFREGHIVKAMPLLERAAAAGDARAQYVCATALFNGDHLACDVARAFELMQRASDAGLAQAAESLEQMRGIIASAAQSAPAVPDVAERSLLSASALARCRAVVAGLAPRAAVADQPVGSLKSLVQALLEAELRERLEILLPLALDAAVARTQVLADSEGS